MEEFYRSIATPSWWIGVVIVGIAVNIASAYLKSLIERLSAKVGGAWSRAASEAAARRSQWIDLLRNDQHAQLILHAREQRFRLQSIQTLLLTIALVVLAFLLGWGSGPLNAIALGQIPKAAYGPLAIAVFSFFISYSTMGDASKCARLLKEATAEYPLPYNHH